LRKAAYRTLQQARVVVRKCRIKVDQIDMQLRDLRRERYYFNNALRASKSKKNTDRAQDTHSKQLTIPTPENFTVEDSIEQIDISQLPRDRIVFAGTDPGVKKMSVTCAQTLHEIELHINRYHVLFPGDGMDHPIDQDSQEPPTAQDPPVTQEPPTAQDPPVTQEPPAIKKPPDIQESLLPVVRVPPTIQPPATQKLAAIKKPPDIQEPPAAQGSPPLASEPPSLSKLYFRPPKASVITAPHIDEVSSTRRIARRRGTRLRRQENSLVREALEGLSKREQVLKTAQNMDEIDKAHRLHRESRD
ncbi:hypothetical protein BGW38_009297, partial [Lunasporangiospora selenospora]